METAHRTLRLGFAMGEISPAADCALVGYEFRQSVFAHGHDGILDPLYARVSCLVDPVDGPLWLIALDLCILESAVATAMRGWLAQALGCAAERILLCCSHTHSGPLAQLADQAESDLPQLATSTSRTANEAYTVALTAQLIALAERARGLTEPVSVRWGEIVAEFGYQRRVMTPAGVRLCWNVHEWSELSPARHPDPTVSILQFRTASQQELVWWSAGVHPVCLGGTSNRVSADWPGAANRLLGQWQAGRTAVYFHGAAGEIHPWLATQAQEAALEWVGRAAAAPVDLALRASRPLELAADGTGRLLRLSQLALPDGCSGPAVSILQLGTCALVFLPLEYFARSAARVRAAFRQPVFFSTVSNGWEGYWPDAAAFEEGGYEVGVARACGRSASAGDALTAALIDHLGAHGHA